MALKGDFIGFSFNGVHSSELGIIRTSDGSRYNENLLPTFQDKTVQVPGGDGSYYFGTTYTNRQFSIPIAFDNLSEANFRKLRTTFDGKTMGKLIFDEAPYKYYMVKPTGAPQLKYICFGKTGEPRVYKGEGTINFVAYYPFAKSVHLSLKENKEDEQGNVTVDYYDDFAVGNRPEWEDESKLPLDPVATYGDEISITNAGDMSMDWEAIYNITSPGSSEENATEEEQKNKIKLLGISCGDYFLNFDNGIVLEKGDAGIKIDSERNLVRGFTQTKGIHSRRVPSKNIYNKYITGGNFFKIPIGEQKFYSKFSSRENGDRDESYFECSELNYEYIYY